MSDAEIAIELVTAGADVVRARFGGPLRRIDKGAGDFATSADTDSEAAMLGSAAAARAQPRHELGPVG